MPIMPVNRGFHTKPVDNYDQGAIVLALATLILHYAGVQPLPAEVLGATFMAVLYPVLSLLLRRFLTPPPPPPPPQCTEPPPRPRSFGTTFGVIWLLLTLSACGHHVRQAEVDFVCEASVAATKPPDVTPEMETLMLRGCVLGASAALRLAGVPVEPCPLPSTEVPR